MGGAWSGTGIGLGVALPLLAVLAGGCTGENLDGFVWDVQLTGDVDSCHPEGEGVPYRESFEYRLVFDGAYVELNIGPDTFATGAISGCEIAYTSVVWGQSVEGYKLRWQLDGEALFRQGGTACNMGADLDWDGTETFEIVSSEHPDIPVGCQYVMLAEGTYQGPL